MDFAENLKLVTIIEDHMRYYKFLMRIILQGYDKVVFYKNTSKFSIIWRGLIIEVNRKFLSVFTKILFYLVCPYDNLVKHVVSLTKKPKLSEGNVHKVTADIFKGELYVFCTVLEDSKSTDHIQRSIYSKPSQISNIELSGKTVNSLKL